MKKAVFEKFGGPEVLEIVDAPRPDPDHDQILVKVHATTVTTAECQMRRGQPLWGRVILGFRRPRRQRRTLGLELAGEVVSVGTSVHRFTPGAKVFAFAGFGPGANAQYTCMKQSASVEIMPANVGYDQAAALVDGPTTALYFLRKADVQPGDAVLINGASGSIGTAAVQLATHFGAEVTAVCSAHNADLVRSLGAKHVVDYNAEDFTRHRDRYDIIFDTISASSFARCRGALKTGGRYLATTGLANWPLMWWTTIRGDKRVLTGMSVDKRAALAFVRDLVERDMLVAVIDRQYPFEQLADAHRYVEQEHKRGNVTISVG
jgi:NADPH:quinone reductase-like Zn-dependent oxidoreductase